MPRALKTLCLNLLLALASLITCVAAMEVFLRATGLQPVGEISPGIYRAASDPVLSYELIPDLKKIAFRATMTTNALGFRSPPLETGKPLVAFLGDSITFGYGVQDDETFPARVQRLLPSVHVLNAAVPGYALPQQAITFREKVLPLNPSLLVHVFYWNDLTDKVAFLDEDGVLRPQGWTRENDRCDRLYGILWYIPGQCWLDKNSAIYRVVKKIANRRYGNAWVEEEREKSATDPDYESLTAEQRDLYLADLATYGQELPPDLPRVFVIWPDQEMHARLREDIAIAAAAQGFRVLDLYETFGNRVPLLGWDHVHAAPEANVTAAEVLVEFLRTRNLLPEG